MKLFKTSAEKAKEKADKAIPLLQQLEQNAILFSVESRKASAVQNSALSSSATTVRKSKELATAEKNCREILTQIKKLSKGENIAPDILGKMQLAIMKNEAILANPRVNLREYFIGQYNTLHKQLVTEQDPPTARLKLALQNEIFGSNQETLKYQLDRLQQQLDVAITNRQPQDVIEDLVKQRGEVQGLLRVINQNATDLKGLDAVLSQVKQVDAAVGVGQEEKIPVERGFGIKEIKAELQFLEIRKNGSPDCRENAAKFNVLHATRRVRSQRIFRR